MPSDPKTSIFSGVFTALITPFKDGAVDHDALARLVERQVTAGIHGLVPCGTTGEASTLDEAERLAVFATCLRAAAGRCVVAAGVGTNDTAQTVRMAKAAAAMGCDAAMIITPYYNKPTQAGLYAHCRAVAEAIPGTPVMVYNVPSRTAVSFTVDTLVRLADVPGIDAVKEATGDMIFDGNLIRRCGSKMAVLSGDDMSAFPLWALGGTGVVSVLSNLMPERVVGLWRLWLAGDIAGARRRHLALLPLFQAMFFETSPGPLKLIMSWMSSDIVPDMRLPLVPPTAETADRLFALATEFGLPVSRPPAQAAE